MANNSVVFASGFAQPLEELQDRLSKFDPASQDTEVLVDLYHGLHPLTKSVKTTNEAVRDELLARLDGGVEDQKGNIRFLGESGAEVEFRPRIKTEFDPEKAKEILEAKGLYEHCIDTEVVVTDSDRLASTLEEVQELLIQLGQVALAQKVETVLAESTEKRETVSEPKIEGFVKRGKITVQEVEGMYDITKTYALFDVTK